MTAPSSSATARITVCVCFVREMSALGRNAMPRSAVDDNMAACDPPSRALSGGETLLNEMLRFSGAVKRVPAIDGWLNEQVPELGDIARRWFVRMRECGDDVRELIHDGC